MPESLGRPQRKRLRELASLAYERELSLELAKVERDFSRWRAGNTGPHELSDSLHSFHNGPARRLYVWYVQGEPSHGVSSAVARGILSQEEVGPELLAHFARSIAFFRESAEDRGQGMPDGSSER